MDIIVALIIEWSFRIISWPFIAAIRGLFFIITLGKVHIRHSEVTANSMIMVFAFCLFVLFIISIYVLYGV